MVRPTGFRLVVLTDDSDPLTQQDQLATSAGYSRLYDSHTGDLLVYP